MKFVILTAVTGPTDSQDAGTPQSKVNLNTDGDGRAVIALETSPDNVNWYRQSTFNGQQRVSFTSTGVMFMGVGISRIMTGPIPRYFRLNVIAITSNGGITCGVTTCP